MIRRALSWVAEEAWEKINILGTWAELKRLGQKYGKRFFIAAVIWELIEDVVFPSIGAYFGMYWVIPFFLVMHFEPVVYPVFFYGFRTWDRIQGREAWEPDRHGMSTYTRAGLQVLTYRLPALVIFYLLLYHLGVSFWALAAYTLGMSLFEFVHNRIWHDSNFGIDVPTDTVLPLRVVAKVCTYRVVSTLVMGSVFVGLSGDVPAEMWLYQGGMFIFQLLLGFWWARSSYGVITIGH